MSEILQANIFFFITGIAVIIFTVLLCITLFHVIKVVKSLQRILNRIEAGTEVIAEDMQSIRTYFVQGGFIKRFISAIVGTFRGNGTMETETTKEEKHKK